MNIQGYVDGLYRKIADDEKVNGEHRPIIRSVHISDIHIDSKYREGAPAECHFALCCRDNGDLSMAISPNARKAGKWGDYKCDIPVRTMQSLFEFIATNQDELKTSFITWTGDNAAHNIWENSIEEVKGYESLVANSLKKALGKNSTIEIFPAIGNHDLFPLDEQDFSEPDSNPILNSLKNTWKGERWLSEKEAK